MTCPACQDGYLTLHLEDGDEIEVACLQCQGSAWIEPRSRWAAICAQADLERPATFSG